MKLLASGVFNSILIAGFIISWDAHAASNCRFPDHCYDSSGNVMTEEPLEDTPIKFVDGVPERLKPKPMPECAETKVCPDYCKDEDAILDKGGEFTGKFKTECMSDSKIKEVAQSAKAEDDWKRSKPQRDAAEKKKSEQLLKAMAKAREEDAKRARAAVALAGNPKKFARCMCSFGGCLGKRAKTCASLMSCTEITKDEYAVVVGNREALLVWNSHAYCENPTAGSLRGD